MKSVFLHFWQQAPCCWTGCGAQNAAQSDAANSGSDDLQHLTVVLDWYPNACMHSCTKRRRRVTSPRKVWMWISSLRQV